MKKLFKKYVSAYKKPEQNIENFDSSVAKNSILSSEKCWVAKKLPGRRVTWFLEFFNRLERYT